MCGVLRVAAARRGCARRLIWRGRYTTVRDIMTAQSKTSKGAASQENGYQRRRRETRRLLMEAGRALFVLRPAEQVSIESITAHAGVAKGSFYNHFQSREALGFPLVTSPIPAGEES